MAQALIRKLREETLDAYRAEAKRNGRSLESELRDLVERNRPRRRLTPEERERRILELTRNQIPQPDSTHWVREARAARFAD